LANILRIFNLLQIELIVLSFISVYKDHVTYRGVW